MVPVSPLRYPGGKQVLSTVLAHLIRLNNLQNGTYAEPYAGGAGAALTLLFGEHVRRVSLNDADPCVFAMWDAILNNTDAFLAKLGRTKLTVAAWRRHRAIYLAPTDHSALDVGFATFFLNRCNRSGIIATGGPIGGVNQTGPWKIDARFTRQTLQARIEKIALYRSRISFTNQDALDFLRSIAASKSAARTFVYLDPPYYEKGRALYLNWYEENDHRSLAEYIRGNVPFAWALSYDNVKPIQKLYTGLRRAQFDLDYHAHVERRRGKELFVVKNGLKFPSAWRRHIPAEWISNAVRAPAA
jgi:DNA adenine methylase